MNARCFRAMIATLLGVVYLFGIILTTVERAKAVTMKAPACGMACCMKGVCECQAVRSDTPAQSAPAAPVAPRLITKFVPTLLALLPAQVESGMPHAVIPAAESTCSGSSRATPIFRLHCALLM